MSSSPAAGPDDAVLLQIENDLPSLACQAAIEIDDVILNRSRELKAVPRLATLIAESIPNVSDMATQASLLDPTAVVVVNRALMDSTFGPTLKKVEELVATTERMTQSLKDLTTNPPMFRSAKPDELKKMRAFCLALSRHASAADRTWEEESQRHPFRR